MLIRPGQEHDRQWREHPSSPIRLAAYAAALSAIPVALGIAWGAIGLI
ncbi:hypothetical protein H9Q16_04315 [Sulfitobacter sp. TSTF-M16]|uniref:Uncharacterized protein n=1 Tax=Sulfitobacter aestuariivivens TaxID=2766981 RepID=A0A927D4A5_9RHOB|nr:hypothetical protein [Sulfitobacter aestuariivivens]MBD3663137.1 hypothetical protein [Sulfitobacter aestuariivivens]